MVNVKVENPEEKRAELRKLVKKFSYGVYSTGRYGVHTLGIQIGNLVLYFSYDTIIAFSETDKGTLFICKNEFSNTTGKHLNWINQDKTIRVPYPEFKEQLLKVLNEHNLIVPENQ